jgi:hypothetical protein
MLPHRREPRVEAVLAGERGHSPNEPSVAPLSGEACDHSGIRRRRRVAFAKDHRCNALRDHRDDAAVTVEELRV